MTIQEIIDYNRRTGSTTWILQSAFNNPYVVVICNAESYAKSLEYLFHSYVESKGFLSRFLFNRKNIKPIFVCKNNMIDLMGQRRPIIFDNSALIGMD